MKHGKNPHPLEILLPPALDLLQKNGAAAILILVSNVPSWDLVRKIAGTTKVLVVADNPDLIVGCEAHGIASIVLNLPEISVQEKIAQSLLRCVAQQLLAQGDSIVAIYNAFDGGGVDSISLIDLADHLGRLTANDLRRLQTKIPLDTIKQVFDVALEIGRDGREGKPVGTLFVVGPVRKLLKLSRQACFDPFKGYSRKDRQLKDSKVREAIKEIAQMDGAFIICPDGVVEAAARIMDARASQVTLAKGLGARHWAAAAITKVTDSIALAVSQTSGTVRVFQNGEMVLRVEPFRRPMKWKDFHNPMTESPD